MPSADDFRDGLGVIEASHRGDAEALEVLLRHGDTEGIARALGIIAAGIIGDLAYLFGRPPAELYELMRGHQIP